MTRAEARAFVCSFYGRCTSFEESEKLFKAIDILDNDTEMMTLFDKYGNAYRLEMMEDDKALEQESFINKPCVAHQVCHEDKVKVLDKIRAEIMSKDGLEEALEIIDKYRAKMQ